METVSAEILNVFIRIKWTKYLLKVQKSGRYVLQVEKSRNDRHQSPEYWLGFLQIIFGLKCKKDANEFET